MQESPLEVRRPIASKPASEEVERLAKETHVVVDNDDNDWGTTEEEPENTEWSLRSL
jgi:hypothetical protein